MIIDHANGSTRLIEAEDFKGFKLRIASGETQPPIAGVTWVDDGNVLIGIDAVKALPGAPNTSEWNAGFQAMVDYAAKKGWIDADKNAIRAHVERAG